MKIFGWMQNKPKSRFGTNKRSPISVNNHTKQEPRNEEFNDWPHGLLAIGTFGNNHKANNVEENVPPQDNLQQLILEVEKLQSELQDLLLHKQVGSTSDNNDTDESDKFVDGNPSTEDARTNQDWHLEGSNNISNDVVVSRGKGICVEGNAGKAINKKSLSFLLKKLLVCRGGFTPTPGLRDQVPESITEKILRAILHKKIYPQHPMSTKKFLENKHELRSANEDDDVKDKDAKGSKWVKTDSEYIVLEI